MEVDVAQRCCMVLILFCVSSFLYRNAVVSVGVSSEALFYVDSGFGQSVPKHLSPLDQKQWEMNILGALGLNVNTKQRRKRRRSKRDATGYSEEARSRFLLDVVRNLEDDEESGSLRLRPSTGPAPAFNISTEAIDGADLIVTLPNHGHELPNVIPEEVERRFWFDVSSLPTDGDFLGAELRVFKEASCMEGSAAKTYTLSLFRVYNHGDDVRESGLSLLDQLNTTLSFSGWLTLNASVAVLEWSALPAQNLGLYLAVSYPDHEYDTRLSDLGILSGESAPQHLQPFLVAYLTEDERRRVRRVAAPRKSPNRDRRGPNEFQRLISSQQCQRESLYISFRALGWEEWIIAPEGYSASFCRGQCRFPLNAHMNASNHAIVQTLVNLIKPYAVPRSCCAAQKLAAISMLYYDDDNNVVLKKYKNMIVKTCGCY